MKVGLISLGCAKNLVDSEMMLGQLKKNGYEITAFPEAADLIIINTCGFIQSAKEEAVATIFEMIKLKKHQKIVVTGCLAQRYVNELRSELPEIDEFITIDEYPKFNDIISKLMGETNLGGLDFHYRIQSTPKFTAYVRIGDGCDNKCTYCAIPLIRGPFKSRPISDILWECKGWIKKGVKELVLIAQDTTRFGKETGECLEDLLERVLALPGAYMVRLLYLYPDEISERLLKIFKDHPNLAPYFDIPIQHASNKILKLMNRRGTKEEIRDTIKRIRDLVPNVIVRTTVMVGFPNETEEDYQELEDFIKEIEFDRLGAFTYSSEDDTVACALPNQVDEDIKKDRYNRLMRAQMKIAHKKSKARIGEITDAFVEGYDMKMKKYKLRDYSYAGDGVDGYIYVESDELLQVGSIVKVKITSNYIYDLMGEVVK